MLNTAVVMVIEWRVVPICLILWRVEVGKKEAIKGLDLDVIV